MKAIVKPVVDGFLTFVPHVKALGIEYCDVGYDWAELKLPYAPHLVAYPAAEGEADHAAGIIASGAIFSLMDTVGGMAVIARKRRMIDIATLDLRIDYLRAATPGKTVVGRAEVIKMTRSVVFIEGSAHDGDPARPVARMVGSYMFTAGAKS